MLADRTGIDTAERGTGRVNEAWTPIGFGFEKPHEPFAPQWTAGDEVLGQHAPGIGPARRSLLPAQNRYDLLAHQFAARSFVSTERIGMELNLVELPA
jgi:hypothetical protein